MSIGWTDSRSNHVIVSRSPHIQGIRERTRARELVELADGGGNGERAE
jgi:hypothetical protein